jgi:hypothetical protein
VVAAATLEVAQALLLQHQHHQQKFWQRIG